VVIYGKSYRKEELLLPAAKLNNINGAIFLGESVENFPEI